MRTVRSTPWILHGREWDPVTIDAVLSSRNGAVELDGILAALAGTVEDMRERLDADNRLPERIYEEAAGLGLFRQLVPRELGGWGAGPIEWFQRGLTLARYEPSFAWVVTQGAVELGWIAAGGDPTWAAEVLADPHAASASTVAGLGSLRVAGGSATLSGSWSFDTGCQGATWIGGLALVEGDAGAAPLRMCWVPADRASVIEDWDALGLRGSGSHSIRIVAQEVALAWTIDLFSPTVNDVGPYRCLVGNGNWPIASAVAAIQLGTARRALDEVSTLVTQKSPAPTFAPLATNSAVQRRLIELEGTWMAATASVEHELDLIWHAARTVGQLSRERRWRLTTAAAHANRAALDVIDGACTLAGSSVAARNHRLARCLLDAHTLRGHLATNGAVVEKAAQVSLGLAEPDMFV
jgi:indole-3-acetate monooxygenase